MNSGSEIAMRTVAVIALLLMTTFCVASKDDAVQELKSRVATAGVPQRAGMCIHISELQLEMATKAYGEGDVEKAQASLTDAAAFAELARDYAIQSHRGEKQSEIAIRKMTRKLANLKHNAPREDQEPIQNTIDRLEKIRDDLLAAMFPKGSKKK